MNFFKDIEQRLRENLITIRLTDDKEVSAFYFERTVFIISSLISLYGSDKDFLEKFNFLIDLCHSLYTEGGLYASVEHYVEFNDKDIELDNIDFDDDDEFEEFCNGISTLSNDDESIELYDENDNFSMLRDCNWLEYIYPDSRNNDIIIEDVRINIATSSMGIINNINMGGRKLFEKILVKYSMNDMYERYKEKTKSKIISIDEFKNRFLTELDKMVVSSMYL